MAKENKVDISVDLCGIKMKNPLIVAAGPYGRTGDVIKDIVIPRADPSAIETKVITCRWLPAFKKYAAPARAWAIHRVGPDVKEKYPSEGYTGFTLSAGISLSVEQWLERDFAIAVEAGKKAGVPIIVNGPAPMTSPAVLEMFHTNADKEIERMAELAAKFEKQGAAALQALFHLGHLPGYAWLNWKLMPKIVTSLKKAVRIPVIAKTPYHPNYVEEVAKPLEAAGVDAIIATGFVRETDIDIEWAGPPFSSSVGEFDPHGGGPHKLAAMHSVARCTQAGIKIPIIGGGGVCHARDVIAYVMAGATCVHLITAAMWEGLSIFKRLDRDVRAWLEAHGYKSLDDIRGIALQKWEDTELKGLEKIGVEVDESRCDGCGICERFCYETVAGAISIDKDRLVAVIDREKCRKCTVCALVCPRDKQAITVTGWPPEG